MLELLKAVLFGIVEGITEWLPVSSTGHLILLNEFVRLNVSEAFNSMFDVVIQLGAILAVIVLFFHKLNPFALSKSSVEKKQTWNLWFKVVAAIIPSGVVGVLFDDWMDAHLHNGIVVSIALIVYGIAFILVERRNQGRHLKQIQDVHDIDYRTALLIGAFQCLSLVPGTSRSGSTIRGAILIGVGRSAGAEFSFFMAIPTMLGASAIKLLKFMLSGVAITDEASMHRAADALLATGLHRVFISLGADGVFAADHNGSCHLPCGKVHLVNATGCGDAFMAAIAWAYLEGTDLENTARAGMAASSIAMESKETINPAMAVEELKRRL